jgi:hypothetical protein
VVSRCAFRFLAWKSTSLKRESRIYTLANQYQSWSTSTCEDDLEYNAQLIAAAMAGISRTDEEETPDVAEGSADAGHCGGDELGVVL